MRFGCPEKGSRRIVLRSVNDVGKLPLTVFLQQGSGLLMSDDDTAFHGEFSDDWVVNGRVITGLLFVFGFPLFFYRWK